MILTSAELIRTLSRADDGNITVMLGDKEYILDHITRVPDCGDEPSSHIALVAREKDGCHIIR